MTHFTQILFYLSWPVSIVISWFAIKGMLLWLDRPAPGEEQTAD